MEASYAKFKSAPRLGPNHIGVGRQGLPNLFKGRALGRRAARRRGALSSRDPQWPQNNKAVTSRLRHLWPPRWGQSLLN